MKKIEENKKLLAMKKPDLIRELSRLKKEEVLYSLKVKAGKETNHARIPVLRKNIARALTILNTLGE